MYLRGAHICEKVKTATDESSGSSDEQNENHTKEFDHTISIEVFLITINIFGFFLVPFEIICEIFGVNT